MELKRGKWGDVKWVGVGERGYALLTVGPRRPYSVQYTSRDEGCYVQPGAEGGWDVVVFNETAENYRLKADAQATLLEYVS